MIDKEQLFTDLNRGMTAERLGAFQRNLRKNLPLIRSSGGLRGLVDKCEGRIIVVAGAGPSLDENIGLLKKFQHRHEIYIVAADMALRPLVSAGIRPSCVFSCETSPVDFFGGIDTSGMHLAAFSCMSPSTLRRWNGDVSFYNWMLEGPGYEQLWETAGKDLGFLATGSTVTTQAVAFSLGSGARSLVLVGNDMGFGSRFYASGTVRGLSGLRTETRIATNLSQEYEIIRKRREYEIRRDERIYFTDAQFLASKLWLEELFSKNSTQVFDCSCPGCSGDFVTKTDLKSALSSLERKRRGKRTK